MCTFTPGDKCGGRDGSHARRDAGLTDAIVWGRKTAAAIAAWVNVAVPGYDAHLSAVKDGERIRIPQCSWQ